MITREYTIPILAPIIGVGSTLAITTDTTIFIMIVSALGGTITSLAGILWIERNKRGETEKEKAKIEIQLAIANTKLAAFGKEAPEVSREIELLKEELQSILGGATGSREDYQALPFWPYDQPPKPRVNRRRR